MSNQADLNTDLTQDECFSRALAAENSAAEMRAAGDQHAAHAFTMQAKGWLEDALLATN